MISKKSIDEILFATKIEEVIGDFIPLKRQGQNFVGVCPFHDDRNPSMHVSPRLGIYKCFVCDAHGSAVTFLMEHNKMTYPEALEYLAQKYSITVEYDRQETPEEKELRNEKDSLYLVNEFAEKYFMDQLRNSEEGKLLGMSYFKERGFKDITLDKFHLGYCPNGWDTFTKHALKKGYKEEFLLKLGLTKKSESGKLYDAFRGRVIFPIHNATGKTIGFGGRVLKKDEKTAKYVNSPESEIYHKSFTLYDIYLAKKTIRQKDNVFLVEGYTDVISMFESGIENVVASSGTSLTDEQVKILGTQTRNITVLYDGDRAGIKAALRGIDMLLEKGLNVKVCLLPDGEDPDSFAKKHRDSELSDYLTQNATDFLLFKAKILSQDAGNDPMKRSEMVREIVKSIAKVQDHIAQSFYIKQCATIFDLTEKTLGDELRYHVWQNKVKDNPKRNSKEEPTTVSIPSPIERNKLEKPVSSEDLVFEAEKNLIILLLKYGLYEINVIKDPTHAESEITRIDQYVCDELYQDNIAIQNPLLLKIYQHYAEVAEILRDQDDIKRTFLLSEDKEESEFAMAHIGMEDPSYSPKWEKRFDMYTNSVENSKVVLQQEVEHTLLSLKLRIVEQKLSLLQKEMGNPICSDDDKILLIQQSNILVKCRKAIADRLNMAVSK